MKKRNSLPVTYKRVFPVLVALTLFSCSTKPVINSFTVTPLTITEDDSVRVNWDVKGEPSLIIHHLNSSDSVSKLMELTLVVTKGEKAERKPVQVSIIPKNAATDIIFRTTLKGDTLIAEGIKNQERWGDRFEVVSVSTPLKRTLMISHAGRNAVLKQADLQTNFFEGTPVQGQWSITSLLTAADKADMSKAPESLQINAVIRYKR